jgi:hypothetical protein
MKRTTGSDDGCRIGHPATIVTLDDGHLDGTHIGLNRLLRDRGRKEFVGELLVAKIGLEFAREV